MPGRQRATTSRPLAGLTRDNVVRELLAAGVIVGTAGLAVGEAAVVILVFVLIAASTVAIPVIAYLVASKRMAGPLEALRGWLVHNNATVMAVLLLVIGVVVIGKGIGSF
jgi:hypothetical protein